MSVIRREQVRQEIEDLARSRVNDAVRLAFLEEGELASLEELDLSAMTEFRRSSGGTVEMKFVDRLAALKWLAETEADPAAGRVYQALEGMAEGLGEG